MPAPLESDKDLLTALGLSEHEAADIVGRSRQSLYQADLANRSNYFKKADIVSLVLEARKRNPKLDLAPVERYLNDTREIEQRPDLQLLGTREVDEETLRKYKDLWIIVPDFKHMMRYYPETVKMLIRLGLGDGKADEGTVTIYTSGGPQKQLVEQKLDHASKEHSPVRSVRSTVAAEDWIAAIPFLILGNPQKEADSFVMTEGRYLPNEWEGAPMLVLLIQKLAAEKLALDKPAPVKSVSEITVGVAVDATPAATSVEDAKTLEGAG